MRKNKYLQEIFSKKLIQGKSFESGILVEKECFETEFHSFAFDCKKAKI